MGTEDVAVDVAFAVHAQPSADAHVLSAHEFFVAVGACPIPAVYLWGAAAVDSCSVDDGAVGADGAAGGAGAGVEVYRRSVS